MASKSPFVAYSTTDKDRSTTNCTPGCGTVFELSPSGGGWTEKILYAFQGGSDGQFPNAGVVMDAAGNLYGNTWQGGSGGGGTVYELSPSGGGNWTLTTIYSIVGNGFTVGRLVLDSGNLYEVSQSGGAFGVGQVFKLTPTNGSWTFTDLHDFTGVTDGGTGLGGVAFDASGNLYGTAWGGSANSCAGGFGCGTVWQITPTAP